MWVKATEEFWVHMLKNTVYNIQKSQITLATVCKYLHWVLKDEIEDKEK